MKKVISLIMFMYSISLFAQQTYYPVAAGNGYGIQFWNSDTYKIHMGNTSEYHFGPVTDYSIKMNMSNTARRGWTWGVAGATPIAALNTLGDFQVSRNLFALGNIGIGTTTPAYKLHVTSGAQVRKTTIGVTLGSVENSWIRDEWLTGNYGPAKWNQSTKKWIRPSGTYNDVGGIVYQDEGTYFIRDKAGTQLEYTNKEFLSKAFMFANIFSGNVGIGTTTPDSKLTIAGHVNIGGTGNARLKTRHIDGKHYSSTAVDNLFLNYGIGKSVYVGSFNSGSPTSNLVVSGNVGIGTVSPETMAHIKAPNGIEGQLKIEGGKNVVTSNGEINSSLLFGSNDGSVNGSGDGLNQIGGKIASVTEYPNGARIGMSFYTFNQSITTQSDRLREVMRLDYLGNLGIGTTTPDAKLTVKGTIHSEEVKVDLSVPGPDYVFNSDYELIPLEELQQYINTNKHLPNIPSAKEMETNGIALGEMNMKLLEKIEELTLYTLKQGDKLSKQNSRIEILEQKLNQLLESKNR